MTFVIAVNILMVALVGALLAATPYLMPPTECFTVTVPPSAKRDSRVRTLYRSYVVGIIVSTLIGIAAVALLLPGASDMAAGVVIGAATLIPLVASFVLMMRARARMQALKQAEGWTAAGARSAALVSNDDIPQPLPLAWELLHLIVVAILAAFVMTNYDRLPEQIPMHANLGGSATSFATKTPVTALFPILEAAFMGIVFTFCHWGILRSKKPVDPAAPATSAYAYGRFAQVQSIIMLGGGLALNASMGTAFVLSWLGIVSLASASILVVGIGLVFVVAEVVVSLRMGQSGGRTAAELRTSDGVARDDDRFYKLGIFYVNHDDPSVWVPKRFGVGWTLNYGQPMAWLATTLLLAVIVGFAVGTIILAG